MLPRTPPARRRRATPPTSSDGLFNGVPHKHVVTVPINFEPFDISWQRYDKDSGPVGSRKETVTFPGYLGHHTGQGRQS